MFRLKNAENRLGQRGFPTTAQIPPVLVSRGDLGVSLARGLFCRGGSAYVSMRRSSVRARLR